MSSGGHPRQSSRIGKYQLIRPLARGGMAELHLARATGAEGFCKLVALKRILPRHAANAEVLAMFLDEARLAATLNHPNVVQVYDIEASGGEYLLAMEYLRGESLLKVMQAVQERGRELPLEHAVAILLGLSSGLHYAHEQVGIDGQPLQIVHRDVSPQNVMITYDGGVKLVDFGIAKAAIRLFQTKNGALKGKLSYMSPEQCRSLPVDRRSDIFALSILAWEITTGRRLFVDKNDFVTMKAIVETDAPAPSSVAPGYPRDLERIILRGLRRRPDDRYPTAQAFYLELEAFARERKLAVSPVALASFMEGLFDERRRASLGTGGPADESSATPPSLGPTPVARRAGARVWLSTAAIATAVVVAAITWGRTHRPARAAAGAPEARVAVAHAESHSAPTEPVAVAHTESQAAPPTPDPTVAAQVQSDHAARLAPPPAPAERGRPASRTGSSKLPRPVRRLVRENGALPPE
jgi:serine/threonine protein kinase